MGKTSRSLFKWARITRDLEVLGKTAKTGSLEPIVKRGINKLLGRKVVSKIFRK